MKRKDDDLLRLAFGELSDDAARAVEAKADAADRAEVEAFRRLREGLQHLPPPPPDGLTAERLRAAILDRELGARRKPSAWGLVLFAPAALAALAFAVLLPRLRHTESPVAFVGPEFVGDFGTAKQPRVEMAVPLRKTAAASLAKAASVAPARKPEADEHPRAARRSRQVVPPSVEPEAQDRPMYALANLASAADEETPKPKFEVPHAPAPSAMLAARLEPQTIAPPPSTIVEQTPGKGGNTERVVIVSNQRDLETGALAATEKEVSSVLVGG